MTDCVTAMDGACRALQCMLLAYRTNANGDK